MKDFASYLDKVKADEGLKEKTKAVIINAYTNQDLQSSRIDSRKGDGAMRKLMGATASIAACLMILIGGYAYYNTPVNYVSLDINPSVELGVNAFNRVVRAEGINADGQALLKQNRVINVSVESALQELVQAAVEQGYVAEDGSTVIALTALSDNEDKAILLRDRTRDRVQLLLREKDIEAVLYADCSNLQIRSQAQDMGISPGKLRLISMMQSLDPNITVEQYRGARITEIISKANELLQSSGTAGIQSQEYERTRAMIMAADQEIYQNRQRLQDQNRIQNQYQNNGQVQAGDQVQNQTQNQYQYQNKGQVQGGDEVQNQIQNQYQYQNQLQDQTSGEQQNQVQNQYQNQIVPQIQTQSSGDQQQNQIQNQTPSPTTQEPEQNRVKQGKN